jgi:type IV pilus assembly protein PilY1
MLLIDNSGSMNHAIWHEDYSPNASTSSKWRYCRTYDYWDQECSNWGTLSTGATSYLILGNLLRTSNDYYLFGEVVNGVVRNRFVKLPDPVGSYDPQEAYKTRYETRYLRWLFDRFNPGSTPLDLTAQLPNDYRMNVAREVAQALVDDVEGVRFGAARFYTNDGGRVIAECGTDDTELKNRIAALAATSNTPLAETLYEVTRYFRGLEGAWSWNNDDTSQWRPVNSGPRPGFTSPIQYRCQKNFTVIITDGEPTQDEFDGVSSTLVNDTIAGIPKTLPDWNGDGSPYYVDDIAEFAWQLDMKTSGNDLAGVSFDDPEFEQQNMYTYTVGFALDHPLLKDTAAAGNGLYYTANNAEQLTAVLKSALADISDKVLSSAASASTQGTLTQDTVSIFPEYNSQYWSGNLSAYSYDINPSSSTYLQLVPAWTNAADLIPSWNSRRIIYNRANQGRAFRWGTLNTSEQALLENNEDVLKYIRGDRSREGNAEHNFRERRSVLGDIVYSAPKYVGAPAFRYPDSLEANNYSDFKAAYKNRDEMIYVGANDGMLHAFDVSTGVERFAFIPSSLLSRLPLLTKQTYEHRFYVDGSPTVVDAYVGNNWKSVLVSGLNRGGQAVFALDVTNPNNLTEANANSIFMWEFTDPDLGYTYSQPAIVKLNTGQWAAVFGNGYNNTDGSFDGSVSSTGNAVLFVVDLATGDLIKKIDTGIGFDDDPTGRDRPNGLATVAPVDVDMDNITDYVYAGDLFGNLWKFDLTSDKSSQWDVAYKQGQKNRLPLFTACNGNNCTVSNRQPITVRPTVSRHPKGGMMVYFGTGKYLETEDKTADSTDVQTFYAVWDKNEGSNTDRVTSRSSMREQTVLYEGVQTYGSETYTLRTTSKHEPNWNNHKGWYIDLPATRERSVRNPILRNGKIIFTTLIPLIQEDPCMSESEGWLMELDAITGSALSYSVFDLNKDGRFDGLDTVSDGRAPGGMKFNQEIVEPTIIAIDENTELKVITKDTVILENPGTGALGRQSWREHY